MKEKLLRILTFNLIPGIGRLLNSKNTYCNVIFYHDIVRDEGYSYMRMPSHRFKEQMLWLVKNKFETLRFDDFADKEKMQYNKKRVLIAFDDGWLSNYTEIFEFMKQHNLKYNVFLTMGEIGKNKDYLTWDMVREMYSSGIVGFGAHTFTHPSMKDIDTINCDLEITQANELFKTNLGFYPLDFCYPFGDYSEKTNKYMVENTNYSRIYTSKRIYSYKILDRIIFGRSGISADYDMSFFKKVVIGYNNCAYKVFRTLLNIRSVFRRIL